MYAPFRLRLDFSPTVKLASFSSERDGVDAIQPGGRRCVDGVKLDRIHKPRVL